MLTPKDAILFKIVRTCAMTPKDAILFKIVHTCAKECLILTYITCPESLTQPINFKLGNCRVVDICDNFWCCIYLFAQISECKLMS